MNNNFERNHYRRQKQNNSLLIPSEKTASSLKSFNNNHRVSLRSVANPIDLSNEVGDNFAPPRVGKSLAPNIRQTKGVRLNKLVEEDEITGYRNPIPGH